MNRILFKIFTVILVYCLLFKPEFIFIPHSTNLFLGVIGFFYYTSNSTRRVLITTESSAYLKPIIYLALPIFFVAFISMLINWSNDAKYCIYSFSIIIAYFANFYMACIFKKAYNEITFEKMFHLMIISTWIFVLLAWVMFVNNQAYNFLTSIIKSANEDVDSLTLGTRLQGFGASYFAAGILLGFVLIFISLFLGSRTCSTKYQLFLFLTYFVVSVTGIMMSRTTLIGCLIGLIIIITTHIGNLRKLFKTFIIISVTGVCVYITSPFLFSGFSDELETLSNFGFEFFYNYRDNGEVSTHSTDLMLDMYKTIPDNEKSWLIGDAKWDGEDGHYYKRTDIGYLRNIWYFGIIGMIVLLLFYCKTIKLIVCKKKLFGRLTNPSFFVFLIFVVVLLLKGPADLFFLLMPFYFCINGRRK